MKRRYLVVGNWKMNTSAAAAVTLAESLRSALTTSELRAVDTAACPPLVYLDRVANVLGDSKLALGAQDVSHFSRQGSYTGEVSAQMLADVGCRYVIVGHSERRAKLAETPHRVAAKVIAAQQARLTPILCVGENLRERESGRTQDILEQQVQPVIDQAGIAAFNNLVLAYEPVWAIGTDRAASPAQTEHAHAFLRAHLATHDDTISDNLAIIYGGGLKPDSAEGLFSLANVDGGLVGGASLSADAFADIVRCAVRLSD